MTFVPIRQVSIHGKRLSLNTTGALMQIGNNSTLYASVIRSSADVVQDSTAMLFAQGGVSLRSAAMTSTAPSTIAAYGFFTLSSGSATAFDLQLSNPIAGVGFELHIDTSASAISIGATSSAIHFASTIEVAAADRTTAFLSSTLLSLAGTVMTLRGMSTSVWKVTNVFNTGQAATAVDFLTIG